MTEIGTRNVASLRLVRCVTGVVKAGLAVLLSTGDAAISISSKG